MLWKRKRKPPNSCQILVGARRCTLCGFDAADVYADRQDATLRVSCPNCGAALVLVPDIEEIRHE